MPYYVGKFVDNVDELIARTPDQFWSKSGIRVWVGHEVTAIDAKAQHIEVMDSDGHVRREPYDELVIATCSSPIRPNIENIESPGVFTVKTLNDGIALRGWIDQQKLQRAVVAGGGYIGLEMADNLMRLGLGVTVIEQAGQLMGSMDSDMAHPIEEALIQMGADVKLGVGLEAVLTANGQVSGVLAGGAVIPADLLVVGLGVEPQSQIAGAAGVELGVRCAVRVGPDLRTNVAHIWAAGDVTETFHRVSKRPVYVPLATVANKQGRIAGINLSGGNAVFPGVLGTAVSQVGELEIGRTGLSSREASAVGIESVMAVIDSETKLGYFPDVAPIRVKLLADKGSGRLIGGQITGGPGSALRIDTVATALTANMTVGDLLDLDLGYAPPFSDVWDPVQVAARVLVSKL